MFSIKRVFEQM